VVAVQIDQRLKGTLFTAAEEPVNGALFVGLQVVFEVFIQRSTPSLLLGSHRPFKTIRRRQFKTSTSVLDCHQALAKPSNPNDRQSSDKAQM